MRNRKLVQALCVAGVAAATTMSGTVAASGFLIVEQSVKQIGNAVAGGAASAEDASTIYFNPAGLTRVEGKQYVLGGHVIVPSSKYSGTASFALGGTILGGDGGDAGGAALVANFYYARDLSERMKFGFGVNAPFGLTTEYDAGWEGRYHALKSELLTVNLNPTIAYQVNDSLSLGAGVSAMYAEATLTNAVDGGTLLLPGGPGAGNADISAKVTGDDWGYGFNFGLLYDISDQTRFGAAFRSKVKQEVEGSATFANVPGPLAGLFPNQPARAVVDLPETLSLSVFHDVDDKWSLMGDVTWTKWSRFDRLTIRNAATGAIISDQPENWDDSYKYSVGLNYRQNDQWLWRFGLAYDETPIQNEIDRTPRIPDNSRRWISVGFTYKQSSTLSIDFAFAHLFVSDTPINATVATLVPALQHTLVGSYEADVNIASAQLTWSF